MLNVADSGEGKTGALASLVRAGYSLRILDFDNGLHVLPPLLTPEEQASVYVETLQDAIVPGPKGPRYVSDPTAFSKGIGLLDRWKTPDYDLGTLKSWSTNDVLVFDSFTMFSEAAMRFTQCFDSPEGQGSRVGKHPSQRDYGLAMVRIEETLQLIFNDKVCPCHVVVNCHLKWMNEPGEERKFEKHGQGEVEITPVKCYPWTLGKQLPPKIGQYFNTVVTMESVGARHYIVPQGTSTVTCKNPQFSKLNTRIEAKGATGGLATVFQTLLGHPGPGRNATQSTT
jgi:hypothetical protein